ncbi:MAG TPA: baseplate J/gp47 family protein [Gammaproteobacteria bacterium]
MPFPTPNLDDRSFEELVAAAVDAAHRACPQWTDRSPADPMIALLEASAFLTDLLIYRVNRMPEKAYVAFLNLIGTTIAPPSAAVATVRFTRKKDVKGPIEIPGGTRIKAGGADLTFVLAKGVRIAEHEESAEARALHCRLVEGELLGVSNGAPGQVFTLAHAPVIADTGDGLDLVIGVEERGDLGEKARSREFGGKAFRVWQAVEAFSQPDPSSETYVCDRYEGRVLFAPAVQNGGEPGDHTGRAALARVPPRGMEIRAWYRCGGGAAGNVAAHQLTGFDGGDFGVTVDNPDRALGGRDAESLQSALARGPHALRAMDTAVTARDFERAALATRVAARARAFARSQVWRHGEPGTVEIQLVPHVDENMPPAQRSLAATLEAHRSPELLERVQRVVAARTPLGVKALVGWSRTRAIAVQLKAVCFREESPEAVERRLEERIYALISPFAQREFGQPLRASDIHEIVAREPGIRYVEKLRFLVEDTPRHACARIRADFFQPRTWHAVSGDAIYRSMDDGDSWCETLRFGDGEKPVLCEPHPSRPGWLAAISVKPTGESAIHLSKDCGETWRRDAAALTFGVNDAAWSAAADTETELYLATPKGLFVYAALGKDAPRRIVVIEDDDQYGFWAVATAPPINGAAAIAVAAGQRKGVWISTSGAQSHKFRLSGLQSSDVRVLETQWHGGRAFLWAGFAAEAGAVGQGCARLELRGFEDDPAGWVEVSQGWKGGSCEAIAFAGEQVFAGSNRSGVLRTALPHLEQGWIAGQIDNGLPIRDEQRLWHEVHGIAVRAEAGSPPIVMVGGPVGVFRSRDGAVTFQNAARTTFDDYVALSEGWLFASAAHEIEIVSEDTL